MTDPFDLAKLNDPSSHESRISPGSLSENSPKESFLQKRESTDAHVSRIPAFAGMTRKECRRVLQQPPGARAEKEDSAFTMPSVVDCQKGSILAVAMIVSMLLVLIGLYSARESSMGARIAANHKLSVQTFYVSQAGIEEARIRLRRLSQTSSPTTSWRLFLGAEDSAANLFGYDSWIDDHSIVSSMQSDMDYTVEVRHKTESDHGTDLNGDGDTSDIVFWGDTNGDNTFEQNTTTGRPIEIVTSVGKAGGASETITAEVCRDCLNLKYAVFGDKLVNTKDSGTIWKGSTSSPYAASIGSNESIEIRAGASVYGDVDIGRSSGDTQGSYADHGGIVWGDGPNYVDRIDPDPLSLFVAESELDREINEARTSNANATRATPSIGGTVLSVGNGGSMTLRSGSYYLTSIQLDESAILTIDVSSGPVTLFLDGPLATKASGVIDLVPSGSPPALFTLYCRIEDNSSSPSIDIRNGATFHGVVYAPRANISLSHNGDFHGMLWGRTVDIRNTGNIVYDPRLKGKFISPNYTIRSWREER